MGPINESNDLQDVVHHFKTISLPTFTLLYLIQNLHVVHGGISCLWCWLYASESVLMREGEKLKEHHFAKTWRRELTRVNHRSSTTAVWKGGRVLQLFVVLLISICTAAWKLFSWNIVRSSEYFDQKTNQWLRLHERPHLTIEVWTYHTGGRG